MTIATSASPAPSPTLQNALRALPPPTTLPHLLPVTHLTIARWFDDIVTEGGLAPRMCKVFNEKLVYLFYGGAFYRTDNHPTENAAELPIAFVFSPKVLPQMRRYFPFDTGAVASGRVGPWQGRLLPWPDGFNVPGVDPEAPAKIVYHLFGSNEKYLDGLVDPGCSSKPEPLQTLHDFLASDLASLNVDHRQLKIECQADEAIALNAELEWVGFPMNAMDTFAKLCRRLGGRVPPFDPYRYSRNFNPYALAQMLEQKAYDAVISRYLRLPA